MCKFLFLLFVGQSYTLAHEKRFVVTPGSKSNICNWPCKLFIYIGKRKTKSGFVEEGH